MEEVEKRETDRNGRAVRTALTTLQYADARAESGGESVARAVMIETGFAPDWLQYELTDPFDSAKPIRTDFAWERQARNSHWASSTGSSNIPTRPCWPDAPPPRRSLPNASARRTYRSTVTLCCALP